MGAAFLRDVAGIGSLLLNFIRCQARAGRLSRPRRICRSFFADERIRSKDIRSDR